MIKLRSKIEAAKTPINGHGCKLPMRKLHGSDEKLEAAALR